MKILMMIKSSIKPHPIKFKCYWCHEKSDSDSDCEYDRTICLSDCFVKCLMTATVAFMPLECAVVTSKACPALPLFKLHCFSLLCSALLCPALPCSALLWRDIA